MAATYIPGLRLAGEFCAAVVRPLLAEHFPQVPYAAALLGAGAGRGSGHGFILRVLTGDSFHSTIVQ